MKRRDTLKTLLVGGVAGATMATGCKAESKKTDNLQSKIDYDYGRTPSEKEHDLKVKSEQFFTQHELETIAVLCDIILPASETAGSATDAEVPEFIEFIVKDLPYQQLPLRGGLMWLDGESNRRFNKVFNDCGDTEQIAIIDDIAFPDPDDKKPNMGPGIKFFSDLRNLTLTGYYTTKIGFDDLGYVGNRPNLWDGVPADVLKDHDVEYDPEWLAKCIDHDTREAIAEWDEEGNLLT